MVEPVIRSVALRGREGGAMAELGGDQAYALRASDGGGSDPYVLAPLPFDTTQITHPENRSQPRAGDPCHPLSAAGHAPCIAFQTHGSNIEAGGEVSGTIGTNCDRASGSAPCIAFSAKDYGQDATEDVAPTMRAMGHAQSHANGGGQLAVALGFNWQNGGGYGNANDGLGISHEHVGPLDRSTTKAVAYHMAVRRLMPIECERLQGFPDGHTAIPDPRGRKGTNKPAADGPRYKALGNSMATNVMRWIGRRIEWNLAVQADLDALIG